MLMDFDVLSVLANPANRIVLDQIVRSRSIRVGELLARLQQSGTSGTTVGREAVFDSLRQLKNMGLIEEMSAPVPEWTTYYVTADGLRASRKVGA